MKRFFIFLILAAILTAASPTIATEVDPHKHVTTHLANSTRIDGPQMNYLPLVCVSRLQRVGEHLFIYYSGKQTLPADTSFHIAHGFLLDSTEEHPELFDFQLQVDGVYREKDFIEMKPGEPKMWVFNFPGGMTGIHVFTGHWFAPCRAVYDVCTNPDEVMEVNTSIVQVTFVP